MNRTFGHRNEVVKFHQLRNDKCSRYVVNDRYAHWLRMLYGAVVAVLNGKTKIEDLYASETKIADDIGKDRL